MAVFDCVLAAELGLEPGPALRDLERSILAHDAQLRQGGSVRAALARSNVPAALNPIVGRARELAAVDELCADHRLVTLVGTGGIGKTTLAVEVAGQTAGRYESGPYFVDLAPLGDVGQVPGALVSALGVDVEPDDDVMERLRDALADRSTVLLIDNCEHLLPGIAELVAGLLGSNPGIRVLATSREPLQVAGEQVWPLDPLDVPPPSSSPEEIRASASGVLFISRLPVNVATHVSSVEDVAAVGVICRNLEGLPLALELAAARTRTLSLPDLADRLGRSISELARPGHGVLPRHRTMRAALAWGHELLSPAGQTALRAMSVFAGGCDLAAFTAVCVDDDADQALEVVDELVRTSFVVVDHSTSPTRYRLLEPVRQFARELLDVSGQRPTVGDGISSTTPSSPGRSTTVRTSPGLSPSTSCWANSATCASPSTGRRRRPKRPTSACGWRVTCTTCGPLAPIMPKVWRDSRACCTLATGRRTGGPGPPATRRSSLLTRVTAIDPSRWLSRPSTRCAAPAAPKSVAPAKCSPCASATAAMSRRPGGPWRPPFQLVSSRPPSSTPSASSPRWSSTLSLASWTRPRRLPGECWPEHSDPCRGSDRGFDSFSARS